MGTLSSSTSGSTADNGEMVIALIDGNSATVKKFYRERDGRIRLQPANEAMMPIYVHENDISIQGDRRRSAFGAAEVSPPRRQF